MAQGLVWQEGLGLFNHGEMLMKLGLFPTRSTCSNSFETDGDAADKIIILKKAIWISAGLFKTEENIKQAVSSQGNVAR